MKESKNSIVVTIIIILLILLAVSIFMIFKNNNVNNEELSTGLTNEMISNEETNMITENVTDDDKTANSNNKELSQAEKNKIEEYIDIICNRPQIIRLKEFSGIANADKEWIYNHIDRNKYEQYATDTEIVDNLQDVFGKEINVDVKADQKNIPNDRFSCIPKYDENEGKYLLPAWGDTLTFSYIINDIKKENGDYIVNVIEYCEDMVDENPYEYAIFAFRENNKHKKIFDIDVEKSHEDNNVIEKVMQNKDEFPTYDITLKNDNNKLLVEKVEKN